MRLRGRLHVHDRPTAQNSSVPLQTFGVRFEMPSVDQAQVDVLNPAAVHGSASGHPHLWLFSFVLRRLIWARLFCTLHQDLQAVLRGDVAAFEDESASTAALQFWLGSSTLALLGNPFCADRIHDADYRAGSTMVGRGTKYANRHPQSSCMAAVDVRGSTTGFWQPR